MHFHFPDRRALCIAENATHTMHNILTLRGVVVRDPRLGNTTSVRPSRSSAMTPTSCSPATTGRRGDVSASGRSCRRSGKCTPPARPDAAPAQPAAASGIGIANSSRCRRVSSRPGTPTALVLRLGQPQCEGRLPTLSRLVRRKSREPLAAPAEASAPRYVEFMGGADTVVAKARKSFEDGDYRWAAEVLNHVIFAQPDHAGGPRTAGRHLRETGLRRRERAVAQFLPLPARWSCAAATSARPPQPAAKDPHSRQPAARMFLDAWPSSSTHRGVGPRHHAALGVRRRRFLTRLHNGVLLRDHDKPDVAAAATVTVPDGYSCTLPPAISRVHRQRDSP